MILSTERTYCFNCRDMTLTKADGSCVRCGTAKLVILPREPLKYWSVWRSLWLAGFAFFIVLLLYLINLLF
jgi:hypothetical protein